MTMPRMKLVKKWKLTHNGKTTWDYASKSEVESRINRIMSAEWEVYRRGCEGNPELEYLTKGGIISFMNRRSKDFLVEEYTDIEPSDIPMEDED